MFAQIGDSQNPPSNIRWQRFLDRDQFSRQMRSAKVIVSHAGMGTILTAIDLGKPILVMPRRAHLGEHRNDHQWATVRRLPEHLGVQVALDEQELRERLERLSDLPPPGAADSSEHLRLIEYLRGFVGS